MSISRFNMPTHMSMTLIDPTYHYDRSVKSWKTHELDYKYISKSLIYYIDVYVSQIVKFNSDKLILLFLLQ